LKKAGSILNHIGITINNVSDINNFYLDILGFEEVKQFEISQDISVEIFNLDNSAKVYILQKESILLEAFVSSEITPKQYDHICLNCTNRNEITKAAQIRNYKCTIIPKTDYDMIFISDLSGNIFELKESDQK